MVGCHRNFLKGLGGPGAPHTLDFSRMGDIRSPLTGSDSGSGCPLTRARTAQAKSPKLIENSG